MLRCAAAFVSVFLWAVPSANAHTITFPDGQTFTFDPACCNGSDCDAIPMDAISEVRGGYKVDYWHDFMGGRWHFKAFIPFSDKRIKFNPFADRVMACSSLMTGDEPGTLTPRCIYPVQPSM